MCSEKLDINAFCPADKSGKQKNVLKVTGNEDCVNLAVCVFPIL